MKILGGFMLLAVVLTILAAVGRQLRPRPAADVASRLAALERRVGYLEERERELYQQLLDLEEGLAWAESAYPGADAEGLDEEAPASRRATSSRAVLRLAPSPGGGAPPTPGVAGRGNTPPPPGPTHNSAAPDLILIARHRPLGG